MRTSVLTGLLLAVVTVGLIGFWVLRSGTPSVSEDAIGENEPHRGLPEQTGRQPEAPADPSAHADPESPAAEPADSQQAMREATRLHAITAAMHQATGGRVVQTLTESGLAPTDSERIARIYSSDLAECVMTSLGREAERQSIPVDQLIDRIGRAVSSGDLNVSDMSLYDITAALSGVIDIPGMEGVILPCWADAAQAAGISFQSEIEAIEEQLSR